MTEIILSVLFSVSKYNYSMIAQAAIKNASSFAAFTLFCFFDRVPPILTASTFAERLNYLLACQSISYSHPHQKYSGGKTLLVEMPGFEPGSCQYFLIRFTLFFYLFCLFGFGTSVLGVGDFTTTSLDCLCQFA